MSTDPLPRRTPHRKRWRPPGTTASSPTWLYHDWEAASYDAKWSISSTTSDASLYAADRFRCAVDDHGGDARWPYGRALGAGLAAAGFSPAQPACRRGVTARGSVTDLCAPAWSAAALRNAEEPRPRRSTGGVARRRADPLRGRDVRRSSSATPCCTTSPILDAGLPRGAAACSQPGGRFVVRGRADPGSATATARFLGGLVLEGHHPRSARLPALASWRRPRGGAFRSRRRAARAGGDRRHPHVRPGRTGSPGPGRGRGRRARGHRGVHGRDARLAGADVRGRRVARAARPSWAMFAYRKLAAAVLAGRPGPVASSSTLPISFVKTIAK